ncbi:MAG TPA: ABC transporter substrate-binding protein, partial [Acidimicrobiales bacterium]
MSTQTTPLTGRRTPLLMVAAILTAVTLTAGACGASKSDSTTAATTAGDSGVATTPAASGAKYNEGTPTDGGKLVWGLAAETDSFSPLTGRWDVSGHMMGSAIFDPLTTLDDNGEPVPYLAESLTPNADNTEWDIKLHSGVMFHDGTPLTADVVVQNLTEAKKALITGKGLAGVKAVATIDPLTVKVTTTQPWATFPTALASQIGYMAAPAMISDQHGGEHPVGTGPFKFKEWVQGDHMSAVKNASYWQKGLPHLDEIDFKIVTDDQQRVADLADGTVDAMTTSTASSVTQLRTMTDFNVLEDAKGEERFATLNTAQPPFDNLKARQAMAYATDINRYIAAIGPDVYQSVNGMFAPGQLGYTADSGYPAYDLAKAKQLVADYTAETGQALSFTFLNTSTIDDTKTSQLLKDMWEQAGMKVALQNVGEQDEVVAVVLGKYQAADWRNFGQPDPDGDYLWWHSSSVGQGADISLNTAP